MGVVGPTLLQDANLARSFAAFMEDGSVHRTQMTDELLDIFGGDDGIFNLCLHLDRTSPEEDIRPYAAMWVEGWLKDGEARWSERWNTEAVAIAREAATTLLDTMRDRAVMPNDFLVYFDDHDHSWSRPEAARIVPRPT